MKVKAFVLVAGIAAAGLMVGVANADSTQIHPPHLTDSTQIHPPHVYDLPPLTPPHLMDSVPTMPPR
jgi:hypothetical protein